MHVADLVRALASRGHALYLAVRPDSPLREPLAGVIASWHEMPLRNSLDLQSARAIADLINQHHVDIVHAHVGRDYLVAALASKQAPGAMLVLTRHHYLPLKRNAVYRWMLANVAAVIAVSSGVRDSVIERLGLPPERVHVIPNWLDPSRFQPIDRAAARAMFRLKAGLVVACIGQITPAKGQEEFIRAASRVLQTRSDVEFLIVGEEADERQPFTEQLRELAASLNLGDKVRFMGYVRHIADLIAAVDIVVVPSWDEGFSLVAIEALAARRPVIASKVGGLMEIIKDNSTGVLVPPRDPHSLAHRMMWLLADAPLRDRLALQGQRDVYARFSREHIIDQIESLYVEVLKAAD